MSSSGNCGLMAERVSRAVYRAAAGWTALAALATVSPSAAAERDDWESITDERLLDPEPGDWLSYRRTYDVTGFSPLRQINRRNVGRATSRLVVLDARQQPLGRDADRRERLDVRGRGQRPRARVRRADRRGRVDLHAHVPRGHRRRPKRTRARAASRFTATRSTGARRTCISSRSTRARAKCAATSRPATTRPAKATRTRR